MRVLIAEDNPVERRLLRSAVESLGHACLEAANGAAAWRQYQKRGADVLISDWLMPGLDGLELCRRVRAHGRGPYTSFLFLTALDEKRDVIAGLRAGADDYLAKPLDVDDLAARLSVAQRVTSLEEERVGLLARERTARLQAEQAVRIRDDVLAAVSHDLNNPLTVIGGTTRLLRQRAQRADGSGTPQVIEGLDEGLQRIAAAATRMSTWIQDLLDVTQLEIGQPLSLNREPTDLVGLAQQAAADQRLATQSHRIRVESALPALTAPCDAARLRRVLDNLLSNAIKYSPAGGEITVTLATDEREGQLWAVLQVRDQGVGIPAADQAHVFERFRRGANVGRIAGTGIGLAGAGAVLEQHGGSLDLQSQEGVGSTFTMRLPLEPPVRHEPAKGSGARRARPEASVTRLAKEGKGLMGHLRPPR
jgi:signal transduction histidine kinase